MKKRFQLPLFALVFFAVSGAHGQTIFNWSPTPTDSLLSLGSNWTGGYAPPTSDANTQLVFGESSRGLINFDVSSVEIQSLSFSGNYPAYFFGAEYGTDVAIGAGGITVPASADSTVLFDSSIYFTLEADQTWAVDGHLTLRGSIEERFGGEVPFTLTKTGTGTLELDGFNSFSGGLVVQSGTLAIGSSSLTEGSIYAGPAGTGMVTLADNTTLRSIAEDIQLHNDVALGNNVTLDSGDFGDFGDLELAGIITVGNADTTIKVAGENPVLFTGTIDGPANTQLTFTSPAGEFGGAAFADAFTANIKTLTADRAGLFFFLDVPTSVTLHAINNGYIGAAAAPDFTEIPAPSPAALLARIASPSTFAGTFGLDTHPESELIHEFTDNLDFSAFTHASFRFGSHSDALISGTIKPVDLGTKSLYPFGGASGHLGVLSDLANAPGKPASILVSNSAGTSPQYVIFRGNNTTTGTSTLNGIAAHLAVENAIAVLDSPGALPGGASGKFTFGAGAPAYIGATEAAFADFNTFLSHLAAGGHNPSSILGLDSHDAFEAVLAYGVDTDNYDAREVSATIDLRSFSSIYLGTASDVILAGTVYAPTNGILKLTAVDDGLLTIAAPLGSNVTAVEIGFAAGTASEEFGDGEIEMAAPQTYSGGTTLRSGTVFIGDSSAYDHGTSTLSGGPLGTGVLTIENGVSEAILAATDYYVPLYNDIVLNGSLQLGSIDHDGSDDDYRYPAYTQLSLFGDISGSGGLRILGNASFRGHNTYTGGTFLTGSVFLESATALGTGTLRVENFDENLAVLSAYGDITLPNPISLAGNLLASNDGGALTLAGNIALERPVILSFYGQGSRISGSISGGHTLMVQNDSTSALWLSGTNTYTGGTQINSGAIVFANASSIPSSGLIRSLNDTYVGAAFNSNVQSDFLNRFDKSGSNGSIGFDTTDLNSPIVVSENLDLSGFSLAARLGTSTAATLSGTITPAGGTSDPYRFGGGGGVLTVQSNLGEGRSISVTSSAFTPLTLVLTGDNRSANGLASFGSIVRLDGANALPSTGNLTASNHGYIGYTQAVNLTPNGFMNLWTSAGSDAILGFDSTVPSSPRTISDPISLVFTSNFNSGTYLGTSTGVKLTGTLTPFGTVLKLTGVGTGNLEVNSVIAHPNVSSVTVGTVVPEISSQGAVTLNAANTYTGGTDLLSSHLILGHASALGTGTLRVGADDSRISVNQSSGLTLANAVDTGASYHQLTLDGENSFTLSGEISGAGALAKTGTSTVTLSGNNSDLSGEVSIYEGKLTFTGNTSAGTGGLNFFSELGIAQFLGNAPVIGPISGDYAGSQIQLAQNSTLTVNLDDPSDISFDNFSLQSLSESNSSFSTFFYGSISGTGASVVYTTPADNDATIYLGGPSTYTGGTTINPGVTVVASHNNALGTTGTITVNGGTLSSTDGVTLASTATRPIVFTAGSIGGSGKITFQSSLVVTNQLALAPGNSAGKLTLQFESAAALVLNSGGTYRWELADAASTAGTGWDFIQVDGAVDLAALGGANNVFNISLHTIDASGDSGYAANFNPNASFSWAILSATSLPNFNAAQFNLIVDSTTFLNATADGTFSLSQANNTLFLNFTPVPEPSTWALMITGLAAIAVTTLRRRRRG